jgi:hypothetical protein
MKAGILAKSVGETKERERGVDESLPFTAKDAKPPPLRLGPQLRRATPKL